MNKSLLMLLALAIVGTNVMVAKEDNSCWSWDRCDGKKTEKCEPKAKREKKPRKKKSCCNWGCGSSKRQKTEKTDKKL